MQAPTTPANRVPILVVSTVALVGLSGLLLWQHAPSDGGMAAADITQATMADALAAGQAGDALLLDFVEPADGEGGSEAAIAALAESLHAELAGFYSEGEHLYRVHGTAAELADLAERLAQNELIEGIEADLDYAIPNAALSAFDGPAPQKPNPDKFTPNDPMYPLQWHLDAINTPQAWTKTKGEGAIIAIVDTGVAYKDLEWKGMKAKAVPDLAGVEMVDAETFLDNAMPEGLDDHAHGTHVAGTVAQATNNGVGVAGVAHEAKIMPLKVLSGDGRGSVAAISNAIRYAADHGAHVINMSLGGPLPSRVMAKAVEYAHSKGTTVICAAGNERRSRVSYPAAYKGSVAVAATDFEGKRSFYSNWGKQLDISAPGGDTRSDKNGDGHPDGVLQNTIKIQDPTRNDYLWFQGTSMASPHAAGVAGLVVASGVTNPDEVEQLLKATAKHPNNTTWDKEYGAGVIDAHDAVVAAKAKYKNERLGFGAFGLLGLLGFAGFGGAGAAAGRAGMAKVAGRTLGLSGGAALAIGAIGTPLAYFGASALGLLGTGLFLSALLPLLLTLLTLQLKPLRSVLAGLNLGWGALLLHGAVVLPTMLHGIPGGAGWDRLFLFANALVCGLVATAVWRRSHDAEPKAGPGQPAC